MVRTLKTIPDIFRIPESCRERFLPLDEDPADPLRAKAITLAGLSEFYPNYEIGRPVKRFHHLVFTTFGEARYETPDLEGVLSPGDLWIAPSPVPARLWIEREWHNFWFHLADVEQWAFLRAQPVHVRRFPCPHPLQSQMEQYVSECLSEKPEKTTVRHAYAHIISVLLERELLEETDPAVRRIRNALAELWEEVNAKVTFPWGVGILAARMHVSPVQLYRLVARHYGARPMEMVARLRMLRAKDLLRNTDYTLDRIAVEVGYETAFALSRAFKRHIGFSPREYRSQSKTD
jgi:AraC-like DNA-binding protein